MGKERKICGCAVLSGLLSYVLIIALQAKILNLPKEHYKLDRRVQHALCKDSHCHLRTVCEFSMYSSYAANLKGQPISAPRSAATFSVAYR
ncbi:hypothetical protein STEG23_034566 [Scotinomys teguina]